MVKQNLEAIARKLIVEGKGILAADESSSTIKKRLASVSVVSTEENRRAYRELLFTTADLEKYISGVILFDETLRQSTRDGMPFPGLLMQKGVIPGIKVDQGTVEMANFPGEMITEGLDGLRGRLDEYRELGARFAKWRAVITIGDKKPTQTCIDSNAHALARYAAVCQEAEVVPIVEPEVLMDGDHDIEQCEAVTLATLRSLFNELQRHQVVLEAMLLKPNMVVPGTDGPRQVGVKEVAERTVRCFRRVVPAAVPGIVFLSGGQSAELATEHLNAMNALGNHPWELSFSYGRALQEPVLEVWRGGAENVGEAQRQFLHRARMNSAARYGTYSQELEAAGA